jgi:hypothetical protein
MPSRMQRLLVDSAIGQGAMRQHKCIICSTPRRTHGCCWASGRLAGVGGHSVAQAGRCQVACHWVLGKQEKRERERERERDRELGR